MNYVGSIQTPDGESEITCDAWIQYVESAGDLVRPPGRPGRNPADGTPIILRPPASTVHLIVDSHKLGTFSWDHVEGGRVTVESVESYEERVRARAREIAAAMDARFIGTNG